MENVPIEIIVHHDGVSRAGPSFDIINTFHKSKDFPLSTLGYYVGYHYWVEQDGTLRIARKETEEGAHCIGHNLSSVGIGLAGNFDVELPSDAQIHTLGYLLSGVVRRWNIELHNIVPHRYFAAKTCYGSRLTDNWAMIVYLQAEVQRIMAIIATLHANPTNPL